MILNLAEVAETSGFLLVAGAALWLVGRGIATLIDFEDEDAP